VLADSLDVARYFEACVAAGANPQRAGNWVRTEVLRILNDKQIGPGELAAKPEALGELLVRVDEGKISTTLAKSVFENMREGLCLDDALKKSGAPEGGLGADALEELVRAILAENPNVVGEIKAGKDVKGKKVKFLQGLVMRETKGQARPEEAVSAIEAALDETFAK
jgi:aspartyl-tRNA(Asn)/glutamyl-tRNA(Gln) amidotransferase subunit B